MDDILTFVVYGRIDCFTFIHATRSQEMYQCFHSVPLTYQTHPDADVCCQLTASPCLLPPPPLLKETVTWLGLTKTNAFPLTFQLAVAPTWSWGRNLSFQKEVLRAWLRSAPVVDVLNQAPVTPRQPALLPPLPTVGPLCPQLPLLPLHRRLQHHPGWVEAAVTVATLNMI